MSRTASAPPLRIPIPRARTGRLPALILTALYLTVVIRTAWVSDDAYISFRSVDNFIAGLGLTYNPGERVQAFTNPLWTLLHIPVAAVTGEVYFTTLALSILASLAAVIIFARYIAVSPYGAAVGIAILCVSKAFTDYSTSGLENPLTHLLLAVFVADFLRHGPAQRPPLRLGLWAALLALNRLDTILLVLPALVETLRANFSPRNAARLALGFAPLAVWLIFALIYYGFPFPNTAYAKLNTGIPLAASVQQGFFYFLSTIELDPVTLVVIAAGLAAPWIIGFAAGQPVALGLALYLAYILYIGGDFMSGRFFSAPLLAAVSILAAAGPLSFRKAILLLLVLIPVGLFSPRSPLLSDSEYGETDPRIINEHGIADERAWYYRWAGLLRVRAWEVIPDAGTAHEGLAARFIGQSVVFKHNIGYFGYFAGPQVYIVDQFALPDALLARLPMRRDVPWRIGHFPRLIPAGYVETLHTGRNQIADPRIADYYDRIRLVISGPIFDGRRWSEMLRLNLGLVPAPSWPYR